MVLGLVIGTSTRADSRDSGAGSMVGYWARSGLRAGSMVCSWAGFRVSSWAGFRAGSWTGSRVVCGCRTGSRAVK